MRQTLRALAVAPHIRAVAPRKVVSQAVAPRNAVSQAVSKDRAIKGPSTFVAVYNPQYKAGPTGEQILENSVHPLHFLTKRRYELRERTGLWWHGLMGLAVSPRRTIRNWCARRLRNAFKEALKARGYDEHGRVKKQPGSTENPPIIRGYLRLQGTPRTYTAENDMLREDCVQVLDEIIKLCNYSPAVGNRRSNHFERRSRLGMKGA